MKLYIRQEAFSIVDSYYILNSDDLPVYKVTGKFFAIRSHLNLMDLSGNILYTMKQKVMRLTPTYSIYDSDGNLILILRKQFSFFKKIIQLQSFEHSFEIDGNLYSMDFNILKDSMLMGSITKKWFFFRDCYELDIADQDNIELFCAFAISIGCCLRFA